MIEKITQFIRDFFYLRSIKKLAEEDAAEAVIHKETVAHMYLEGAGTRKKPRQALDILQEIAEGKYGVSGSAFLLGDIYFNGLYGVERDYEKAFYYLNKITGQHFHGADCMTAVMLKNGWGVEKDTEKALQILTELADFTHFAWAQSELGLMYARGEGVEKDLQKALKYIEAAAEQNYGVAQANMAHMYRMGEGVEKDLHKSVIWYERAAENNYEPAGNALACLILEGALPGRTKEYAVNLLQELMERGNVDAIVDLGWTYASVDGYKDKKKSWQYYVLAAKKGSAAAQDFLGSVYLSGGTYAKCDYKKARFWLEKAAEQNFADSCTRLAFIYLQGRGVTRDVAKADEYFKKANELRTPPSTQKNEPETPKETA